ncbi:MAG: hypothetical protein JWN86_413 [Planctomycetota bacterium]|nr:hypothetical protein [Planctomycetota bacterium]
MAAAQQRSTVVGVFEDRHQADKAVSELQKAGFRQDQIGVAMRQTDGATDASTTDVDNSHATSGAITGALTGLGLGALAGLGVLAGVIPVIGPAIAAGTLGVILSNAAAGAGIAGLVGALIGAGVPENEAKYYHDEFEAGRVIVTVTANGRADEATAILRRFGAYDMSTRGASATTTQGAAHSAGTATHAATGQTAGRQGDTIQVKEERLHAEKRPVEAGEVTVRKEIHTENKTLEVPVQREEVVIERTPVHGRAATEGISAGDLREGEQVRIPVREEQLNVTKETVVTEEVKVGKRAVQDTERVSGQVRKEEVKVEQTGDVDVRNCGTNQGKGTNPA